jgi:glucokinase
VTGDTESFGIDLGGTKCLGVVLGAGGEVLREVRVSTPYGFEALLETMAKTAHELGVRDRLGVGAAGLVTAEGVLRAAPNLPGTFEFDIQRDLSDALGLEVIVDNDATCAALAEWRFGAGRGCDNMVIVTLGTGIGGGLVAGGALQRGAHGFTGEYGHMVVDPNGPPCVCGRSGCWERYASGAGLARLAREAVEAGRLGMVRDLVAGDLDAITGDHVRQAASDRDGDALALVDEFCRWVALGLVNLTNLLDPEVIVIGGGLSRTPELYLGPIESWFTELLYAPDHRPHPRIESAAFVDRAAAVGAAILAADPERYR